MSFFTVNLFANISQMSKKKPLSKKTSFPPKLIHTIEKHQDIWKRYQEINRALIAKHGTDLATDLSKMYRYRIIAEEFYLTTHSVRRIVTSFLNGTSKEIEQKEDNAKDT